MQAIETENDGKPYKTAHANNHLKDLITTMNTTIKEENGVYVLYIEGRLDTSAALQMGPVVESLEDCWGHDIVLDCSAMDYISSSGLRVFLQILKSAKAKHSRITVRGLTPSVRQIFDSTGFTELFGL